MNYEQFLEKNRIRWWLSLCIILSGAYTIEFINGLHTLSYYIVFLLICWGIFTIGLFIYKYNTSIFKHVMSLGFTILYIFVLLTTTSALSIIYILTIISIFVISGKTASYSQTYFIINVIVLVILVMIITHTDFGSSDSAYDNTRSKTTIQLVSAFLCYGVIKYFFVYLDFNNTIEVGNTIEPIKGAGNDPFRGA